MKVAVIGAGFGDEGKGLTVNWLCKELQSFSPAVVRFSGGSQCGHGVRPDKNDQKLFHEFQTLGSGTFQKCETYWTKEVVFDPISVIKEIDHIREINRHYPSITMHPECPVITPYDVHINRTNDDNRNHGTVGKGIFTTKKREKDCYHFQAKDLESESIMKIKLEQISKYYNIVLEDSVINLFLESATKLIRNIACIYEINYDKDNWIFEGSQGLLLDKYIGFFPNCTPSKLDLPIKYGRFDATYIVTRAYHTRHGNGILTTEHLPIIRKNKWETNHKNDYQGEFRTGILDLDLLSHAIYSSNILTNSNVINLVITCLDVVEGDWRLFQDGKVKVLGTEKEFVTYIVNYLKIPIHNVYLSHSPFSENIAKFER